MVRPKAHPFSPNALLCLLLSPVGAIGRAGFAGGGVLLALFALATDDAIRRLLDDPGPSGFVFALVVAWSAGCLSRKRLHDIGWSGIAIAIFLAVYILAVLARSFPAGDARQGRHRASARGRPGLGLDAVAGGDARIDAAARGRQILAAPGGRGLMHRFGSYVGPKMVSKARAQRDVGIGHRRRQAEVDEAGDAVVAHAAGHDAGKMRQIRIDIERDAVKRDPAPQPNADRGDLVFGAPQAALVGPRDPDADAVLAPLAANIEAGERRDHPGLERRDEGADILAPALQVEHHIGNALAGAMIGELAAAARPVDGKARPASRGRRHGADVPAV